MAKKNPAQGRALYVCSSTLTPIVPFQSCRSGGMALYS
ncbi:hypothetical protein FHR70_004439 [Microvirga lupini]|uniref:Uncharacterized protein n=1 Tax=Microvirga lupini TaxID=420324 RepID=A0A7W4VQC5_9HYPH|nr:hypothetical protein [Microvirga lupini]